jgi:processive 1,2-diacylglycerol beta-glucosyltransferase
VKTILILTASFGEGHNAAARNLRDALAAASPDTRVVVSDVFLEAYGNFNRACAKGYIALINHFPGIWQKAFEILDHTRLVEGHIGIYQAAAALLERLLDDLRPALVVSTYPGCNHLLDHVMRRRVRRPFRTVTIITDSLTINSVWHRAHSDLFLVANDATAEVVRRAGVPAKKILAPGFPVPRVFATFDGLRPAPPADGRWKVLYVINSGRHLAPGIVRELLTVKNISLSVTVGRDEELRGRVLAAAGDAPVTIHGWTPEMPRLMAENHLLISKAGGATVQESLAARTPMIITQVVPGQEEGNARLILENHAGALATSPLEIASAVENAFRDEARQWQAWLEAATPLSRPAASDEIAGFLLSL